MRFRLLYWCGGGGGDGSVATTIETMAIVLWMAKPVLCVPVGYRLAARLFVSGLGGR